MEKLPKAEAHDEALQMNAEINEHEARLRELKGTKKEKTGEDNINPEWKDALKEVEETDGYAFLSLPHELQSNRLFALEAVKTYAPVIKRITQFNSDKSFIETAAQRDMNAAFFAIEGNPELKNDREFMLRVIDVMPYDLDEYGTTPMFWASEELKKDRDLILKLVEKTGKLDEASQELLSDRELALKAVDVLSQKIPSMGSEQFKEGRSVARTYSNSFSAIEYLFKQFSLELKNDEEFVQKIVEVLRRIPPQKLKDGGKDGVFADEYDTSELCVARILESAHFNAR